MTLVLARSRMEALDVGAAAVVAMSGLPVEALAMIGLPVGALMGDSMVMFALESKVTGDSVGSTVGLSIVLLVTQRQPESKSSVETGTSVETGSRPCSAQVSPPQADMHKGIES